MNEFQVRIRTLGFRVVVLLAYAVLVIQLWQLQIVEGARYNRLADANRFREITIPSSRGVIYDRNGEQLVRNRPAYNVVIVPAYLPDDDTEEARLFARLSSLLNLPVTTQIEPEVGYNNGYFQAITHHQYNRQLRQQIVNPRSRQYRNLPQGIRDAATANRFFAPFIPVTIAEDVDPLIIAQLEEERFALPGVVVEVEARREYLYGSLFGPILGYTGPIPAEQFGVYAQDGYDLVDTVGLYGLEAVYEDRLRELKGTENIEVDANGQKIRTVEELVASQPGQNLRLTLDLELQEVATEALQEMMDEVESNQGVVVALDPRDGAVRAMVSLPSFDNNAFARGITPRELSLLSEDPWTPLINHAIAGFYPPGSTFKIVTAAGGLQAGTLQPDTTFFDEGTLLLPTQFAPTNFDLAQPFFCWLREGHGEVNVVSALAFSCNVFFYQAGGGYFPTEYDGLGLEGMVQYSRMFGYGEETGIDLPGEGAGLVPTEQWKRLNQAERWVIGDTYNMSIGQGFVLATPLQVANSYAAIANGGILYHPFVVQEILDAQGNVIETTQPEPIRRLDISPQNIRWIQEGLRGAIDYGTAEDNFDVPGLITSGKTGTAEFCDDYPDCIDRNGRVTTQHAWYATYAPSFAPELVVVAFVYGGRQGSETSIPVTNRILRHYFNVTDETEVDSTPLFENEFFRTGLLAGAFNSHLLATDAWPGDKAAVSGIVLDGQRRGLPNIDLEVVVNGEVVASLVTSEGGKFDYFDLDPDLSEEWEIRLSRYAVQPPLKLQIAKGIRFLVEFEEAAQER